MGAMHSDLPEHSVMTAKVAPQQRLGPRLSSETQMIECTAPRIGSEVYGEVYIGASSSCTSANAAFQCWPSNLFCTLT